jgi:hypothetical protein
MSANRKQQPHHQLHAFGQLVFEVLTRRFVLSVASSINGPDLFLFAAKNITKKKLLH